MINYFTWPSRSNFEESKSWKSMENMFHIQEANRKSTERWIIKRKFQVICVVAWSNQPTNAMLPLFHHSSRPSNIAANIDRNKLDFLQCFQVLDDVVNNSRYVEKRALSRLNRGSSEENSVSCEENCFILMTR